MRIARLLLPALLVWPALARPQAASAPPDARPALVGHDAVIDIVERADGALVTLGDDGLVIVWQDDQPVAWKRFSDADDLARTPDGVAVAGNGVLRVIADDLAELRTIEIEGRAPCRGSDAVWAWTLEPPSLTFIDATRETRVASDQLPLGDATCSVSGSGAALAWDDGIRAVGVDDTGTTFDSDWDGDRAPRAVRGADGWTIALGDAQPSPGHVCDRSTDGRLENCAAPDPRVAERFLRPRERRPIGARLLDDGVAILDRAGWTLVRVGVDAPEVVRHAGRMLGGAPSGRALAFDCDRSRSDAGGSGSSTLRARELATGEVFAERPVPSCPAGQRVVSGRAVFDAGDMVVAWDPDAEAFVGGADAMAGALRVDSAWSGTCAGVASSVFDRRSERRVFGPVCGHAWLVDAYDAEGRRLGAAVCAEHDAPPVVVLRADGTAVELSFEGDCSSEAIRAPRNTEEVDELLASDALRRVARSGAGIRVWSPTATVDIVTYDRGVLIQGPSGFWASEALWRFMVWGDASAVYALDDPASASVWAPGAFHVVFAP